MKKYMLTVLIEMLVFAFLFGQFTGPEIYYNYSPSNKVGEQNTRAYLSDFGVQLAAPIPFKKDTMVIQPSFNWLHFKYDNHHPDMDLYGVAVPVIYFRNWSKRFKTIFSVIPRLHSDFHNLSSDHLQFGGALVFAYRANDRLEYELGGYYNREFFGHFFVPFIGLNWDMSDRFRIRSFFPRFVSLEYLPEKDWVMGLKYTTGTFSYRIGEGGADQYMERRFGDITAFTEWYIYKNVVLQIRFGHSFIRELEIYDKDDQLDFTIMAWPFETDNRTLLNEHIKNGVVLQVGIIYRVID